MIRLKAYKDQITAAHRVFTADMQVMPTSVMLNVIRHTTGANLFLIEQD